MAGGRDVPDRVEGSKGGVRRGERVPETLADRAHGFVEQALGGGGAGSGVGGTGVGGSGVGGTGVGGSGVGGAGVGDPACDLTIAWTFLDTASREVFRKDLGASAAIWDRAKNP